MLGNAPQLEESGTKLEGASDVDAVISIAGDSISAALDAEKGSSVTDPAIYRAHAAKYEKVGLRLLPHFSLPCNQCICQSQITDNMGPSCCRNSLRTWSCWAAGSRRP